MAYLTVEGALAGPRHEIDLKRRAQYEPGKNVTASSGCLGCHRVGENGNAGPGPNLTDIGDRLPARRSRRPWSTRPRRCRRTPRLQQREPQQFNELVEYLGSLKSGSAMTPAPARSGTLSEPQVQAMFDRIARSTT